MKTILIVEDNDDMQQMLRHILENNYHILSAFSETEGLLLFQERSVDLVLLDRMLPGENGDSVLTEIRQHSTVPVIMLTALTDANDVAMLLMAGANDYVTKPFNIEELQARITVQLRKPADKNEEELKYKSLTLLTDTYSVTNGNQTILLKKKEFEILRLLFEHPRTIFTKENLYEQVWEAAYYGDENTINVHLSNLRTKLYQLDDQRSYIETIWGIGVRLA